MLSRRTLVGRLAAGAAVAWVGNVGLPKAAAARETAEGASGAAQNAAQVAPDAARAALALHPAEEVVTAPTVAIDAATVPGVPPPWELVRPLAPGAKLGRGWYLAELSGVADGSCVLTLRNARGRTQRVHLCRNSGHPQGLVYTERLDLVVMNGGQGDLPTEEGLAQAVATVAHVLAANEAAHQPVVTALLPQSERVRRFAGAMDRKLR